jgi:hypothetical protein
LRAFQGIFDHGFPGFHGWKTRRFLSVPAVKSVVAFQRTNLSHTQRTKKKDMADFKPKPGRFCGVIGRRNLPLGKRGVREVSAKEAVQLPPSRLALDDYCYPDEIGPFPSGDGDDEPSSAPYTAPSKEDV